MKKRILSVFIAIALLICISPLDDIHASYVPHAIIPNVESLHQKTLNLDNLLKLHLLVTE